MLCVTLILLYQIKDNFLMNEVEMDLAPCGRILSPRHTHDLEQQTPNSKNMSYFNTEK